MKRLLLIAIFISTISCVREPLEYELPELFSETFINTIDNEIINNKVEYLNAELEFKSENWSFKEPVRIKGRGHSSWEFPKKSYTLNFFENVIFFGLPEDKNWVFLANHNDKTLLRNALAFELGKISNFDWSPNYGFTELYLNNNYIGLYQIVEKIEAGYNRVYLENSGYIIEIDQLSRTDEKDILFRTNKLLFNIKSPNIQQNSGDYEKVKEFLNETENILFSDNFKDPANGYKKYIDLDSFIDWYLINEITKNNDAVFWTSCYMNYIPGKKLKMGPIWDFDISLGNINYNDNEKTSGFWINSRLWYERLFEDPDFVLRVKDRFNHFYSNKELLLSKIDKLKNYIENPRKKNNEKWKILGKYLWPNYKVFNSFEDEDEYLTEWFLERLSWLESQWR